MQKNIILLGGVVVIVAGLAVWVWLSKSTPELGPGEMMEGTMEKTRESMEQGKEMMEEKTKSSMDDVEHWAEAALLGKKLKCTYIQKGGDGQTSEAVMYVDGKKYRTEFQSNGVEYVSVFDGNSIYSWKNGGTQGMQLEIACMKDLQSMQPGEQKNEEFNESSEDAIKNAPDVSCSETGSVDVSVPEDITFTDQCAVMREQVQNLKNLQGQMPEEMQKMMDEGEGMGQ